MQQNRPDLRESFDRLAEHYAQRFNNELDHKPLDRQLLTRFADHVRDHGPVCDLGCGPGHIARFLHGCGLDIFGLDLSPMMIQQARQLNPVLEFRQGDMLALAEPSESLAGIVAFYSIIHIPRPRVVDALREMLRVLRPGGTLLLSFHLGDEDLHLDELWGETVNVDIAFFERAEMEAYVVEAGFEIKEILEREPYPDIEYPSRRAYFLAGKPGVLGDASSTDADGGNR